MTHMLEELFRQHGTLQKVKKQTIVLYQSEVPRRAFMVKKGLVRAYVITSGGEERTVALHSSGDIIPLSWLLGKTSASLFYYDTLVDSEIYAASKPDVTPSMTHDPALMAELLALTTNEHTSLLLRITALEQPNAAEKIALTMHYLLFQYGKESTPGFFTIDVRLTQSLIASLVGLTRESTAINLKALKEQGIITYINFTYIVNKSRLERFVGEDSFKNALETTDQQP